MRDRREFAPESLASERCGSKPERSELVGNGYVHRAGEGDGICHELLAYSAVEPPSLGREMEHAKFGVDDGI